MYWKFQPEQLGKNEKKGKRRKELLLSLFSYDMILLIENPKELNDKTMSANKLQQCFRVQNQHTNISDVSIYLQKQYKKKIKKAIPFIIASKIIK